MVIIHSEWQAIQNPVWRAWYLPMKLSCSSTQSKYPFSSLRPSRGIHKDKQVRLCKTFIVTVLYSYICIPCCACCFTFTKTLLTRHKCLLLNNIIDLKIYIRHSNVTNVTNLEFFLFSTQKTVSFLWLSYKLMEIWILFITFAWILIRHSCRMSVFVLSFLNV